MVQKSMKTQFNRLAKAMELEANALGGFSIPIITDRVFRHLTRAGCFRANSQLIQMATNTSYMPVVSFESGQQKSPLVSCERSKEGKPSETLIVSVKRTVIASISSNLAEDPELAKQLSTSIANRLAYEEDAYAVAMIESDLPSSSSTHVAGPKSIKIEDLLQTMESAERVPSNLPSCWYMSPSVYAAICVALGNVGGAIPREGGDARLLGQSVRFVQAMNNSSATESGSLLALYGNLRESFCFASGRLVIQIMRERVSELGIVEVLGVDRFGCALTNSTEQSLAAIKIA